MKARRLEDRQNAMRARVRDERTKVTHPPARDVAAARYRRKRPNKPLHRRTCACGTDFVTTRSTVRWHSNACRKRHYRLPWASASERSRKRRAKIAGADGGHTHEEWRAVLKSQAWRCFYCCVELTAKTWSRDHKIPLSRGGSDAIENIVAACRRCNSRKGARTVTEFLEGISVTVITVARTPNSGILGLKVDGSIVYESEGSGK